MEVCSAIVGLELAQHYKNCMDQVSSAMAQELASTCRWGQDDVRSKQTLSNNLPSFEGIPIGTIVQYYRHGSMYAGLLVMSQVKLN